MSQQEWIVGEPHRVTATFSAAAISGDPTPPILVSILDPDGQLTLSPTEATQGASASEWYYDFTPTKAGDHLIKFKSAEGATEIIERHVSADPVQ